MKLVSSDVVVTDLIMPFRDGLDLCVELRRDYPDVKIIAMSAAAKVLDNESIARNFNATLAKPFSQTELLAAIQSVVEAGA